jgi:hypothetical protein
MVWLDVFAQKKPPAAFRWRFGILWFMGLTESGGVCQKRPFCGEKLLAELLK